MIYPQFCLFAFTGFIDKYIDSSELLPYSMRMNACYYKLFLLRLSLTPIICPHFICEYRDSSSLKLVRVLVSFASIGTRLYLYECVLISFASIGTRLYLYECVLVSFASIGTRLCLYECVFSFHLRV